MKNCIYLQFSRATSDFSPTAYTPPTIFRTDCSPNIGDYLDNNYRIEVIKDFDKENIHSIYKIKVVEYIDMNTTEAIDTA